MLQKARESDLPVIWEILQDAIAQRRAEGSDQWQNGYPSEQTARDDIAAGNAYVLVENETVLAYAAIIFGNEPAYDAIDGRWLTDGRYAVVHRVARSSRARNKGIATRLFKLVEELCIREGIPSIRLDTNFDNAAMLRILDALGYSYCGEIFFQGAPRRAYEKVLVAGEKGKRGRK
jgi:ribosomal protein S18 acetylase RimI-like enzyme